ncbi:MAG: DUF1854 domain-containing protein [Armatimonadetes bacterium]|nr:DUF1854 domain-containing protein [Armatimonadota bacterium]
MNETEPIPVTLATTPTVEQTQTPPDESGTDPRTLRLFYDPPGTVRLSVGDSHSYGTVKLYQSAPLSRPNRYISLQSGKSEEILMVSDLSDLTEESRKIATEELARRYLTARVLRVSEIRTEFGITYWHVDTDKGERDFVIQSMAESCLWLSDDHLLLTDSDGNRFEIVSRTALDAPSRAAIDSIL